MTKARTFTYMSATMRQGLQRIPLIHNYNPENRRDYKES